MGAELWQGPLLPMALLGDRAPHGGIPGHCLVPVHGVSLSGVSVVIVIGRLKTRVSCSDCYLKA